MLLWESPNDGLGFEEYLKAQNIPVIRVPWLANQPETTYGERVPEPEPITGATYPCGALWPQKPAEDKIFDLSQRLADEQQTVQRLVRLLDEAGHEAAKWRTRCFTRLGLAYGIGFSSGFCLVAIAWWAL